jgi:phosphoribosylformimino-5-aminoimidazole carboxamide ribotide isomerase
MPERPLRPRLIPVLDVMGGQVVRAGGGLREKYQPIACPFTSSRKPFDVAGALLQMAGTSELYIADLDAITTKHIVSPAVRGVMKMWRVPTWLDAGIGRTHLRDLPDLPHFPHLRPVVGFETCREPGVLTETLRVAGEPPVGFSIDLKHGRLLGNWRAWGLEGDRDALALARRVVDAGVRTLIVLDLARVGTGTGTGTEPLLMSIRREFPSVELVAGGGVKTWSDIERLGEAGADAVLVASALYDGTLARPR